MPYAVYWAVTGFTGNIVSEKYSSVWILLEYLMDSLQRFLGFGFFFSPNLNMKFLLLRTIDFYYEYSWIAFLKQHNHV